MDRRSFVKASALLGVSTSLTFGYEGKLFAGSPANTLRIAIIGLNGRGKALTLSVHRTPDCKVACICDVDAQVLEGHKEFCKQRIGYVPPAEEDFRKVLENKEIDAVAIATPDHWHAPMAIMALQAGKHVYVEKPCSHNPQEGEWLVNAQAKYKKVVQMGNQQRSGQASQQAIRDIRNGVIGDTLYAKAWYANNRKSIGKGKEGPVPTHLNYELWQGPAPRTPYRDNVIHYNWHWFWRWGTGEVLNNGTHEIDICRWALNVNFPEKVTSEGGRFYFDDDWEFYDTQTVTYDYAGNRRIVWEGLSCSGMLTNGQGRGTIIHGTKGSIMLTRNEYTLFDLAGKPVKNDAEKAVSATTDTTGEGLLDVYHMQNFANAIREGEKLNAPIHEGNISVTTCHLGNIAQKLGRSLQTDPVTGKITNDKEAMQMWGREYEKGWKPAV